MDKMLRTFIALDLSTATKQSLSSLVESLKKTVPQDIKWVQNRNLHITLQFLGHTPEEKIPPMSEALKAIAQGFKPMPAIVTEIGMFPDSKKPRVLWVGFNEDAALSRLAREVNSAMEKFGFVPEKRRFVPHVTLARINSKAPEAWIKHVQSMPIPPAPEVFDHITLYQSQLHATGSIYTPLEVFPF